MKNLFLIIFTVLATSFSFGQISQELGEIKFVEIYDMIKVTLVKSDKNTIEISGAKADEVQLITKNNKLKIRMSTKQLLQGSDVSVTLYHTSINEIHANEGSIITSVDVLTASSIALDAKEGAEIYTEVETNDLNIKTNSGGKIQLNGTAHSQNIVSNTGGYYDGQHLESVSTTVLVKAGGEAVVYATDVVNAKTMAGGNIYIYGNADINQQTIAGGKIHIY